VLAAATRTDEVARPSAARPASLHPWDRSSSIAGPSGAGKYTVAALLADAGRAVASASMQDTNLLDTGLLDLGRRVGHRLAERGDTVAVAEGSCGGLVSAALLAVPGASAYYRGGAVVYTGHAVRGLIAAAGVTPPDPMRGASEPFAAYLAESIAVSLRATWGIGEGGATGPSGNPYGDPPGHCWVAVFGPQPTTRHVLTGDDDRQANMTAFATAALELLTVALE
jgi:PncC family amidohydrolase